jgi:uncharacterized protein YjbI with pentapeptide repeats
MSIDLNEILAAVAKGALSPSEAKIRIEKAFGRNRAAEPAAAGRPADSLREQQPDPATDGREILSSAFDKLRKTVNVDELLKISSGLVNQIAENMPGQFGRLQENLTTNFEAVSALGFSAGTPGVDAKLSVFRTFHVGNGCRVEGNQVVGSQWFGVNFDENAEVVENKFTAVQFSEVAVVRSTLGRNVMGLSRLSNVTFQESRVEGNRFSRSTFSDVSLTESDLDGCRMLKSEFSRTVMNASRLSRCVFEGSSLEECEFDGCELEGVTFENCSFRECSFEGVAVAAAESVRITGLSLSGRSFRGVRSVERFLELLNGEGAALDEREAGVEEAVDAIPGKRGRRTRGRPPSDNSPRGTP